MDPIDALGSPELSGLLQLERAESMNMREFGAATNASPAAAREILRRLKDTGLVEVSHVPQGATKLVKIELSALGHKVAAHVMEIDRLLGAHASGRRRRP